MDLQAVVMADSTTKTEMHKKKRPGEQGREASMKE